MTTLSHEDLKRWNKRKDDLLLLGLSDEVFEKLNRVENGFRALELRMKILNALAPDISAVTAALPVIKHTAWLLRWWVIPIGIVIAAYCSTQLYFYAVFLFR